MAGQQAQFILENDSLRIKIDTAFGTVASIYDISHGIELIGDACLADNWRLLLPLQDVEANYILGRDQPLSEYESDGKCAVLRWDRPLMSEYGAYNVQVRYTVRLDGDAVVFSIETVNHTQCQLAEVWYATVGGMRGLGSRQATKVLIPKAGQAFNPDMFSRFIPLRVLGTTEPESWFMYPGDMPMPWMDIYNPDIGRGVYYACLDTVDRFKTLRCEMHPGIGHMAENNWPGSNCGHPVGVTLSWVCFPYSGKGARFESPEARVQFHPGDWHDAAAIYRKWFTEHFHVSEPMRNWIRREPAFQDTMLLLPEGNVNYRFSQIPGWATDALEYGVKAVLVSGWQTGGHDSHYPDYSPDPRLGTWEDLRQAIAKCHEMGAKVYFFVNHQIADCNTEWYESELYRYRSMDRWGNSQMYGWGMGTLGARMGVTSRKLVYLSPWFKEVRDIITRQMAKLAEIGADGIHIDKLAWAAVPLEFNPSVGTGPDRATWEGVLLGVREIAEACHEINPGFAISYEGAWDRMLEHSCVAWAWHNQWETGHTAAMKYTFPEWLPGFPIIQPYDYDCVNTAMRYGYQLFIGPACYTRSMKHPPMRGLSEYIREAIRIRNELSDIIYLGDFMDTGMVNVVSEPGVQYNTHRCGKTGLRACILANYSDTAKSATVAFDGGCGTLTLYEPFQDNRTVPNKAEITIAPKRLAVLAESG